MHGADLTRRRMIRWLGLGGAASMVAPPLVSILEACSNSSPAPAQPRGGTVSWALPIQPNVLDPATRTLASEGIVSSFLFPGLLRMNPQGKYQPELAQSYSVDSQGTTFSFRLRPHLTWEDGQPLTSRDFAFTQALYTDPKTGASTRGWEKVDRVETPNETTVVYRLKEPYAPFLVDVAAGPVLPQHVLGGSTDIRHDRFNRNPVGCGQFKLKDWQSASTILLEANPRYWKGRPKLDQVLFKVVPDVTAEVEQLETGEVDIVNVSQLALWDHVKSLAPKVATAVYDDLRYVMVQLDQYQLLKQVEVRQALDYATPKPDIIRGVLRNLATPALADIPRGSPYYNSNIKARGYDPKKASELLAQAGFSMQNGFLSKGGQTLEVPIYTVANLPVYVQIAQVLKDSWSKIGVKASITTMEAGALFSQAGPQYNGKDGALIFGIGLSADPYNYPYWSSRQIPDNELAPGENHARYVNADVDRLVVEGGQVTDFQQRKRIYDELQSILVRDVPVIFLYWQRALYAFNSRFRGFRPTAFSGVSWEAESWTKS